MGSPARRPGAGGRGPPIPPRAAPRPAGWDAVSASDPEGPSSHRAGEVDAAGPGDTGGRPDGGGSGADDDEVDLSKKPVLEWTNHDWERWISSPSTPLPAADSDRDHPRWETPPTGTPPADAKGTPASEAAASPAAASPAAAPPADTRGAAAAEADTEGAAASEAAAAGGRALAVSPEGPGAGQPGDDDWTAAGDHPWWGSSPERADEAAHDLDPPTRVVPPVAMPAEPTRSSADDRVARPRPARPHQLPRAGAEGLAARPALSLRDHRVRSALSLLGLAVVVGTVAAALIVVGVLAISVALRQAVG